jgi:hypothetical protein
VRVLSSLGTFVSFDEGPPESFGTISEHCRQFVEVGAAETA